MARIFIAHSDEQASCAEHIRRDLEQAGYTVWKDKQEIQLGLPSYVRAIEQGIRGSAGIIVIWSAAAAKSEWVEREIMFAQQLKKPLYLVLVDSTVLSILLVTMRAVNATPLCNATVAQLLSHLPPATSDTPVQLVAELLTHEHIRKRKEGIDLAQSLLAEGRHREELLALLEDTARKDLMLGIREKAQYVVDIESKKDTSQSQPDESRHVFPVRCPKGHITYLDRRILCANKTTIKRSIVRRAGAEMAEMYVQCDQCGDPMVVLVDCESYK